MLDAAEHDPWDYFEDTAIVQAAPERTLTVAVVGFILLAIGSVFLLTTFRVLFVSLYFFMLSRINNEYRHAGPVALAIFLLVFLPAPLLFITGTSLLRMADWARRGAIAVLIFSTVVGGLAVWTNMLLYFSNFGSRRYWRNLQIGDIQWWNDSIASGVILYALIALPLAAILIVLLTRPRVIASFKKG